MLLLQHPEGVEGIPLQRPQSHCTRPSRKPVSRRLCWKTCWKVLLKLDKSSWKCFIQGFRTFTNLMWLGHNSGSCNKGWPIWLAYTDIILLWPWREKSALRKGDRVEAAAAGAPTPEAVQMAANAEENAENAQNLDFATSAWQSSDGKAAFDSWEWVFTRELSSETWNA